MFGHDNQHDDAQATPLPEPQDSTAFAPQNDVNAPTFGNDAPADTTQVPPNNTIQPTTAPPTSSEPANNDSDTLQTDDHDDLLNIKQKALQELSPLVGHLDQTPEEKFRTTMMMIQASDDQSLINEAYEAAQNIPDEKVKAQALLDIVNEINYFTQQHHA